MNILILEDEPLVAEGLIRQVMNLEPGARISGPVATVKDARRILRESSFDLVISDIQLADGISLDAFTGEKIACPIIFTTAFNEYAIKAFKLNSIDYLLKPVDQKELGAALDKFHLLQSKFRNEFYLQQVGEFFNNFPGSKKYKERFAVHAGKNVILVPTADVVGFVKEEIIFLVSKEGRKLITDYRSLDEVEELIDPGCFFRANRQFIIQLDYIESLKTEESGKICVKMKLPASPEIVISKEKAGGFRSWIQK